MESVFIRTSNLSRVYSSGGAELAALWQVSITVAKGAFVGICGTSGSGKSTLINLLGGLDTPTGGEIHVDGTCVTGLDRNSLARYRLATVGMIFQSFNLVPSNSALENVMLPMVFAEIPKAERARRAAGLLDQVGLAARASHRPKELSGGEQQRVAIARALANAPKLLLADEPTGNLDSQTSRQIMRILAELNREKGLTVVMISHDRDLLEQHAERIVTIQDGRIASDSTAGGAR
ncbi:MAG: ABC transporter ATP-binding protein [Lentisphaerae bacterium]|nr:ABC transporter ATP-binding protein [Lentisphaerota bacterium]